VSLCSREEVFAEAISRIEMHDELKANSPDLAGEPATSKPSNHLTI
jgi:hypothetical protein